MSFSLWIDPSFGASGDMLLGAFSEMLDEPEQALFPLQNLPIEDWEIDFEETLRNGLTATKAEVSYRKTSTERKWSEIDALLKESSLPPLVIEGSRRTFLILAQVEAEQHGVALDDVHFHEVGAVDAILDAAKQRHTIIEKECTGCELCLPPCPVDCITMPEIKEDTENWKWKYPVYNINSIPSNKSKVSH